MSVRQQLLALLLVASVLGCGFVQEMGTLTAATPAVFTARGETLQFWQSDVIPGKTYEVTLVRNDGKPDAGSITVCAVKAEFCPQDDVIANESHGTAVEQIRVTFVAPQSGQVYLIVTGSLGEKYEPMGLFRLLLRETQP